MRVTPVRPFLSPNWDHTHPSSPYATVLSSVTLYIMEGSRETFSMNMGEVVMF